ncbi:MAG TPA: sigma-70 family RNA polymerase sigma factor [Armatimonadota bacterium]
MRVSRLDDAELPASSRVRATTAPLIERDSDTDLICRYLDGDEHAFEIIFRKYEGPIFNLVSRMVSGEDAYDLTQDVFCNALRSLPHFRGDSKFSTWLYSIARNVCLNRIRHAACIREESLEQMSEDQPHVQLRDKSPAIESVLETHELQRIVNSVLLTLSPEQRLLVTLRDFEQLSYDEIAEVTGMSLVNVKSKLHRARMAFKDRFKPYLPMVSED